MAKAQIILGELGGAKEIVASTDAKVAATTNILTVDGMADAYIVNTYSNGSANFGGNVIASVSSGTFEKVEDYTYGDNNCKTWFVSEHEKGSTLTITFQTQTATKWATALTLQ